MTHTRRKSLSLLSSGSADQQEPLQMEGSSTEQGAEGVEPGRPASPAHLTGRRKNYPLRKRPPVPEKPKACKVLLTRLESVCGPRSADEADELPPDLPRPPSPAPSGEDAGLVQPRKRRLASLNAEALNNLLLEREDGSLAGTRRPGRGDSHRARDRAPSGWAASKKRPRLGEASRDLSPEPASEEGTRREGDPAPKRLASLNAAAFLKLSRERELPLRPPRAPAEAEGRSTEPPAPKVLRPKWAKVNGKNYPKARQGADPGEAGGPPGWQEHPDEPRPSATPCGPSAQPPCQPLSKALESPVGQRPHLPLLMGGQAALKPEPGRPGEESPAPKQELHQPSFPVPQLSPLPMPGNPADYSGLCAGPELTALGSFYLYCGQDGLQCGGYSPCPMLPEGKLSPVAAPTEGLLLAPSSVPSGTPFQHPPWSSSRYCPSEKTGANGYSICGVLPLPLTHIGTACGGSPYRMPFAADGCRSLGQLEFPLPEAGHPASPAHPLLGCPVPSVPPAAEPVPHVQTPTSEPQTVARACPQSAKPPSGSKSGLRTGAGCRHTARSKAARRPSHPKQPRAQRPRPRRRRRTNGWVPVGAACEKAVYVLDEPEPAIRKSYQAVERHGETIRVRDTVLLKSGPRKTSTPYVAKISALWENPDSGELMMSLLWYYRPEHLQGGRSPSMHEPLQNEVFASRHQDQNSVACIEEKCYVLTFAEYCRFCAMAKRRGEGLPSRKTALVPPSSDYSTPPHRTVPEDTDPELVFLCRHVYDFRHGRILKNPQ
ncbi:bromo adjacent homology domain-containing 1 protein isoform X1 [Dipodomys spectabilis]|uniref:bromo adjacent homology domain-containing 1 protein isoform X1 n=1 Tax=Dipodomys spectabilis TaxID=105255 RepID=UPI001C54BD6F|nr:bromo adjacent homology domain-containing 1 protein isoform X1 [Dipodomys spectabilis]XP_042543889.1 bromo adjacent homology domain-containing 1 protein isoform X1 [Dipodomys spectabilis]